MGLLYIFLGEMSIEVHCQFFKWSSFVFIIIKLSQFIVYSGYKFIIKYMICKYFHPFGKLFTLFGKYFILFHFTFIFIYFFFSFPLIFVLLFFIVFLFIYLFNFTLKYCIGFTIP